MNDRFQSALVEDSEVVEIPLLLSGWQITALETAAHQRGLTAAEMVRHVLRDFLARTARGEAGSPRIKPSERM